MLQKIWLEYDRLYDPAVNCGWGSRDGMKRVIIVCKSRQYYEATHPFTVQRQQSSPKKAKKIVFQKKAKKGYKILKPKVAIKKESL